MCSYTSAYFPFVMMSTDAYAMMMIMPHMTLEGLLTFKRPAAGGHSYDDFNDRSLTTLEFLETLFVGWSPSKGLALLG